MKTHRCKFRYLFFSILFVTAIGSAQTEDLVRSNKLSELHREVHSQLQAQPALSLQYAMRAQKECVPGTNENLKLQVLADLSLSYRFLSQLDSALYFGRQSLLLKEGVHDSSRGRAYANMGSVFFERGVFDSALFFQLKGLKIREKLNRTKDIVASLYSLGAISNASEDKEAALFYFERCLKEAEQSKDNNLIAQASNGMASYYLQNKIFDRAIQLYSKSADFYHKAGNERDEASCLLNIGSVYDETGQTLKSVENYFKAFGIFKGLNDQRNILLCYSNLGVAYVNLNQINLSLYYLHKARGLARDLNSMRDLQDISENLSTLYKIQGKPDSALFYFESFNALKDSLITGERLKDINRLQETYQKEKREQEIAFLKTEEESRNQEVVMERRQNLYLLISVVLLALLALGIFIVFRQRARTEKRIADINANIYRKRLHEVIKEHELKSINQVMEGQENERKRIAEDLHDRLGSMLSSIKLHFNAVEEKLDKLEVKTFQQYTRANSLLDEVCSEVRNIAHNMESGVLLNFGLVAALEDLRDMLKNTGDFNFVLNIFGLNERLSSDIEITVYRVIQELLSNTIRHSGAKKITIDLTRSAEQLTVVYSDDGKGFDTRLATNAGMGLKNIRSRLRRLSGQLYLDSGKNNGATSIIEIPLLNDKGIIGR